MIHAFWIVPLVLLLIFLVSPRFRGDIAESRVKGILANGLEKSRYTILNDVTLPASGGTVHFDHLVVSRMGIFVIESQYARGWISGGEHQDRWKQHYWGRYVRFDNPAHRNTVQVEALANLLNISRAKLHPLVVLVGHKGFKTKMPPHILPAEKLIATIRKRVQQQLDGDQADQVLMIIDSACLRAEGRTRISKLGLLRVFLLVVLVAGAYVAFRDQLEGFFSTFQEQNKKESAPGLFRDDGTRKTEQELWEDSLVCAYSVDTGRCACYERDGAKAKLDASTCQSLAERGSVLKK